MTDTNETNAPAENNNEAQAQEKIVTPLGRGAVKQENNENESKTAPESKPAEQESKPADNEDASDLLDNNEYEEDNGYVDTPVAEVNDFVASLKSCKIPYSRANLILKEAFNDLDTSKLDKKEFEAIAKDKNDAAMLYTQAKLAIMAIKENKAAERAELNQLAGGDWNGLVAKAKKMLPKEELAEIDELLKTGGVARKIAVRELISRTSNKSTNKPFITGDTNSNTDDSYISATQFKIEQNKIADKYSRAGMLTAEGRQLQKALEARRLNSIRSEMNK